MIRHRSAIFWALLQSRDPQLTATAADESGTRLVPEPDPELDAAPTGWAERSLWALVGVAIITFSVVLLPAASLHTLVALLVVAAGFWGLAVVIASVLDLSTYPAVRRLEGAFAWATALVVIGLMLTWGYLVYRGGSSYGTDELAFDQYAAQLLAHGHNPYLQSMGPAFRLFGLGPNQHTYTTAGQPVLALSYPALSFLAYVPFILLGLHKHVAQDVDLVAWVATVIMLFTMLPRQARALALVIGCATIYLSTVVGGDTDVLYVPLLIMTAYRWDRFGTSRRSYIGPICLGLAMAVKQTPWPILAFMLVAIALDESARSDLAAGIRRAGRYGAAAVLAFLLPNLPFILASPSSWLRGVLTPFTKNLVPSGQGIVALTLFDHLGGGSLAAFTLALVCIGALLIVAFIATYPLLRPATFLLAALVYLFGARSQTNYLIEFVPVVLVGAATVGPARWPALSTALGPLRSRVWGAAVVAVAALAFGATAYALTDPSPLTLTITGETAGGRDGHITAVGLLVRNDTGAPLTPHYTVQRTGGDTTFWTLRAGARTIAAGASARIELTVPDPNAEPNTSDGFSVVAFTEHPSAVSVSHRFLRGSA